jgi:hypothetical protein
LKVASSPLAGRFNVTPPSIHFSCHQHQPGPLPFPLRITPSCYIQHTPFVLEYTVWIVLTLQLEEFLKYRKKQQTQPRSKDVVQQPQVLDESHYGISQDLD